MSKVEEFQQRVAAATTSEDRKVPKSGVFQREGSEICPEFQRLALRGAFEEDI